METSEQLSESPATGRRRRRMLPWVTGSAITVFWLVMMFTLVRDKILPHSHIFRDSQTVELARLTEDWKDTEEYMLVKIGPVNVGAASTNLRRLERPEGGFSADFTFGMGLNILGVQRNVAMFARSELEKNFDLAKFHLRADLSPLDLKATGKVVRDNLLVEYSQAGNRQLHKYRLDRKISMLDAVRPVATRKFEIKPGNSMSIPVVDPIWSMEHGMLDISVGKPQMLRIGNQDVQGYPVDMRLNDFVSTSWVDAEGNTLRRKLVGNLILDRTTRNRAMSASPALTEEVSIPELNEDEFALIPETPLEKLSENNKSPLSILGSLVK